MTPKQAREAEIRSRQMMVDAQALAGLIEAGATQPERVLGLMRKNLRAIHTGDGDLLVVAVDDAGNPRLGPMGPMTPTELAEEMRGQEAWWELAWKPVS